MAGGKGSGTASVSQSNTSSSTKRTYGNTSTTNPYVTSKTTNKGTTTNFAEGSGADTFNKFYNENISNVLNSLLNPSISDSRNQALVNSYANNLNKITADNTEGVVNNLANRGLIRSSVANDMYKNIAKQNTDNLADYQASLMADSQNNSTNLFNTLMNAYLQGWNIVKGNQAQSLDTSSGNATTTGKSSTTTYGASTTASGGFGKS